MFSKGLTQESGIILMGKNTCQLFFFFFFFFFMKNPYMKLQNPSMHGSEVMLCIKKSNGRTQARTHKRPRSNAPPISARFGA